MLSIGDKMPSFEVIDQDGNTVRSEDFIGNGRKTIVYFYPKDNTSGCTAEACSFRDNYAELTAAGYNVVGVSKDSAKSHGGFRAKYELPVRLLADSRFPEYHAKFEACRDTTIDAGMYQCFYSYNPLDSVMIRLDDSLNEMLNDDSHDLFEHAPMDGDGNEEEAPVSYDAPVNNAEATEP